MNPRSPTPLKFLFPGWYAIVMGLCGLALAFHRAAAVMGDGAGAAGLVIGLLALGVFIALAIATLLRGQRYPQAWAEDRKHPVRHTFIATLPIALLLLATVAVASGLHAGSLRVLVDGLWWLGAVTQLWVTWWVLARWLRPVGAGGGLPWPSVTPALFIPVVGNVLAPLAGWPLGHSELAAAQFGVGLLFWPVVMILLVMRIATQGLWPERLLPTTFIVIAPPAVVGLALLQMGAPTLLAWGLWGMALFSLAWVATLLRRIGALPFGLPHWAMSFPLAALSALTLRLGEATPAATAMAPIGIALLAGTALIVAALSLATVRGLRDGSLLAPEPVAPLVAAPTPGG